MAVKAVAGPSTHLAKWWLKHAKEQGRITRHLSPKEIHPVKSLIESIPYKTARKIKENAAVLVPSAVLLVGTVKWGVQANDEHHREHWD
ncbi:hypothetical protein Poli38472_001791 [Pythium oligandrum]|uniref:Cytochrome b-c1 complex subunit 8 n=1 Tax=Pythium oligandrum TaxID=41045 RepID=A0A8K1CVV5_PYTOL|nr:hypothetical protein Poli38472_001791 [Pythium oligandrum]|eukprot:TMW69635.1 hypothetical protein Poli38472_001791 [Pythium oligandrum]